MTTENKPVDQEVTDTLRALHEARTELKTITDSLHESKIAMFNAWEEANRDDLKLQAALRDEIARLENAARSLAVAAYRLTGNKAPYPGLNVKITKQIAYDHAKAFAWAKEHNLCLKLDTRAMDDQVKAMIKRGGYPDWITTSKTPAGTISTDLGKVLEEA